MKTNFKLTGLRKPESVLRKIFGIMFNKEEQTAIINALYRRADDLSTKEVDGDERLRTVCRNIAMELMR